MPPTHSDEGLRAAQQIRAGYPEMGIVILSQHVDSGTATRALAESPERLGYLLKDRVGDVEDFVATLRRVANGGSALDPTVVSRLLAARTDNGPLEPLTPREREVLQLVAEGLSNRAVAERLGITLGSTEKYVLGHLHEARAAGYGRRVPARARGASVSAGLTLGEPHRRPPACWEPGHERAPSRPRPPDGKLAAMFTRASHTFLFRLGIALIALHVLDDNFIQPEPGTSAGDHLVSGLLPLGLLGLAAWAYPRLRGAWQGAMALVFGLLGIAAGSEGFHYARELGPSGDDFTGLLCFPAGVLLLGVGAVTLWRTRRTEGSLWWRYPRRALIGAAAFVPAVLVVVVGYSYGTVHTARRGRAGRQARRAARGREVRDSRRSRARGLVHPVAQRRRGDLLSRPQRVAEAGADARPPRLRRAAVRPPRRGPQ